VRTFVVLVAIAALAGCSEYGMGFKNHPLACAIGEPWPDCLPGTAGYENSRSGAERRAAQDRAKCESYGFTPGTEAFGQCLMAQDMDRRQDQRADELRRAMVPVYQPPPAPVYLPPPAPVSPVIHCTSSGSMTTCF
jgi:hypothetical protein